ncbi:EF-hand domain-containing protein [Streptomyces sp. NPDC048483]|uniref:EF-hand domain-containing protein n=1 Tax=Streptomyces sp. NPDC048483 TaxID=3154927 RepID=UPI00341439D5
MSEDLKNHKFHALFQLFDTTGQGYLTQDGFRLFTDAVTGLVPSDDIENAAAMRQAFERWWGLLLPSADTDGDGRIDRQEFVSAMRSRVISPGNLEAAVLEIADSLMRAWDTNKDGVLSKDEYLRICTQVGLDAALSSDAFSRLDRDGDGVISHDEFRTAVTEFYLSDDETAPGNWLLGPLLSAGQ